MKELLPETVTIVEVSGTVMATDYRLSLLAFAPANLSMSNTSRREEGWNLSLKYRDEL